MATSVQAVPIITIYGPLTYRCNQEGLGEQIDALVADGHRIILVNLEGITDLDSSGYSALIATRELHGGKVRLVSPSDVVARYAKCQPEGMTLFD